jgi:hypothetical protein
MAQIPRTPVHFPRMKVRGRRNKAKLAARHVHVGRIPYARPIPTDGGYQFVAIDGPEPGAVSIDYRTVTDGFGRRIPERPRPKPAPIKPAILRSTSYSFTTKVEGDTSALWKMLTGQVNDGP